jgi:hypothetical protein
MHDICMQKNAGPNRGELLQVFFSGFCRVFESRLGADRVLRDGRCTTWSCGRAVFSNAAGEEQAKPKPLVWQFAALAQEQRFVMIAEHSLATTITVGYDELSFFGWP